MPAPLYSAPAKALEQILHGPSKTSNSEVILLDYRHKDTFTALWLHGLNSGKLTIAGHPIELTDGTKQILLIGNDPPDEVFQNLAPSLQGINFRSHFTATSWLAAWKVKFAPTAKERQDGKNEPLARISVIDPREAGLASGAARALQTILGAHDASGHSLVPRSTVINGGPATAKPRLSTAKQAKVPADRSTLSDITGWLCDSKADERETSPHFPELLKSTIWNELTSNRGINHALSNVLGAFLLQAEVGGKNPDPATKQTQEYLEALLQSCGTALKPSGAGSGGWITKKVRDRFDGAVLIDDMAEIWAGFLASAFGSGGGDSVRTTGSGGFVNAIEGISPSPDNESLTGLAGRLSDFLTSGRPRLLSADLIPTDTPDRPDDQNTPEPWQNFVLFLDLRLGLGERFQKQLLRVGTALLSLTSRHLPWLTDASRAKFKAELESGRTDETLLPRLIALLDPTLPIVIFSSTHRTELIGSFRDYGNIITAFRKPILTGLTREWTEVVNELRSDFVSALDAASGILSTRKLLADLEPVEPLAV